MFPRTAEAIARSRVTLIGVVIWKDRLPGGLGGQNIRALSWRLLAERFEAYLRAKGGEDLGIVVSGASNRTTEAEIRAAHRVSGAGTGRNKGGRELVFDDVFSRGSRREPLMQGVDVAAYILQRRCRGDALFAGWFDALKPSMWMPGGDACGFGITNYPDPG